MLAHEDSPIDGVCCCHLLAFAPESSLWYSRMEVTILRFQNPQGRRPCLASVAMFPCWWSFQACLGSWGKGLRNTAPSLGESQLSGKLGKQILLTVLYLMWLAGHAMVGEGVGLTCHSGVRADLREGGFWAVTSRKWSSLVSASCILLTRQGWTGGLVFFSAEHILSNVRRRCSFAFFLEWGRVSTESSPSVCASLILWVTAGLICETAGGPGSACGWGTVLSLSEFAWPLHKYEPQRWPH